MSTPGDTALPESMLQRLWKSSEEAAQFLKTIANENRLLLLCVLSEGEYSVTELEHLLKIRQPSLSQQLARLRADDLVVTRREGKTIYYSLDDEKTRDFMALVYRHFCNK